MAVKSTHQRTRRASSLTSSGRSNVTECTSTATKLAPAGGKWACLRGISTAMKNYTHKCPIADFGQRISPSVATSRCLPWRSTSLQFSSPLIRPSDGDGRGNPAVCPGKPHAAASEKSGALTQEWNWQKRFQANLATFVHTAARFWTPSVFLVLFASKCCHYKQIYHYNKLIKYTWAQTSRGEDWG